MRAIKDLRSKQHVGDLLLFLVAIVLQFYDVELRSLRKRESAYDYFDDGEESDEEFDDDLDDEDDEEWDEEDEEADEEESDDAEH